MKQQWKLDNNVWMETFSDTRKRNDDEYELSKSSKRRRDLRDKMEMELQIKEKELQIAEQRENTMQ